MRVEKIKKKKKNQDGKKTGKKTTDFGFVFLVCGGTVIGE